MPSRAQTSFFRRCSPRPVRSPVRHSIQFPFDKKQPEHGSERARERKRSEPRPHLPSAHHRRPSTTVNPCRTSEQDALHEILSRRCFAYAGPLLPSINMCGNVKSIVSLVHEANVMAFPVNGGEMRRPKSSRLFSSVTLQKPFHVHARPSILLTWCAMPISARSTAKSTDRRRARAFLTVSFAFRNID